MTGLIIKLLSKIYKNGNWFTYTAVLEAEYHILSMVFYTIILGINGWLMLFGWPLLLVYPIYKELAQDGHLERMRNGTETELEARDMWTDLMTRYAGMTIGIGVVVVWRLIWNR